MMSAAKREKGWMSGGWWFVEGGNWENPGETRVMGWYGGSVLWVRWS